ncbi:NADH-quinone oxidoreductase subunit L [Thalassotalea insulae]|uniref:NADH-quinone oxidoreductase subunit L n=1 Tax=Thalassotalea insulae TaxID=2056778 RepID=A0ABQ6GND4_9GAMM|nr:NADH-quinone oxidoreductase subunit L [Thalassotalea insulae]GLX77505.1 NADH-quinone oxidoreductase subunit L [Thalassotalea insulae]
MLLALLPVYPLISFLLLITLGKRLSWLPIFILSVGSLLLCALSSLFLSYSLANTEQGVLIVRLWRWFSLSHDSGIAHVNFSFYLDGLSAVMISVVSGVGFLIHLFASIYMKDDENFSRFMAYMNLFIVSMLILVLADNLVLLYLGWEGVGLCSFLLIGFWYQQPDNVLAARKAFIVTRIGDTAMAIGLFLLFKQLGSVNINEVSELASNQWAVGSEYAYWICLLLLGGAVGKSAQLPLQTWLPDAMAGPTPVSALIHAATMVTAGVYLIARMNSLFLLSPEMMHYVAWVGAATLLLAGIAALVQTDIKRVLAYSTMSQIGYMMLALGAGAWSAGIFHLMTHAFFKALLFLTAGAVIYALHHQQNIFKMGGLIKKLPLETALFVIGLVCLMALPGTSGFFSKEAIIAQLWASSTAGPTLWWCAIVGALLTSIYSCRLFFLAFLGKARFNETVTQSNSVLLKTALLALAFLSLIGGLLAPDLEILFEHALVPLAHSSPEWLHTVAIATPFVGIVFSWVYFKAYRLGEANDIARAEMELNTSLVQRFCRAGLGFDFIYSLFVVKPFVALAQLNRRDIIDQLLMSLSWYVGLWRDVLVYSQNGLLRWYAAAFVFGLVLLLGGWLL